MRITRTDRSGRGAPPCGERAALEFAAYAASLSGELAVMARARGLDMLGYLLEMARLEAEAIHEPADAPTGAAENRDWSEPAVAA